MSDLNSNASPTSIKLIGDDELLAVDVDSKSNGRNGLQTKAEIHTIDAIPDKQYIWIDRAFTNVNGETGMDVDGSGTSIDFEFAPPAGEVWYVTSLQILITDSGSADPSDFGAINGVVNGFQVVQKISGVEHELGNFIDNTSLSLCFSDHAMAASGSDDSSGWFDSDNFFMGAKKFRDHPIRLIGDNGDKLIGRVRDKLKGLKDFVMTGKAWRVI